MKRETGENPVRTRHRIREQKLRYHWETGKMADARILSRETCLIEYRNNLLFQTTSNWSYMKSGIALVCPVVHLYPDPLPVLGKGFLFRKGERLCK